MKKLENINNPLGGIIWLKKMKIKLVLKDLTANPAPLGLLGFGLTTVLLNIHNAGFYPINSMILAMGIAYGGVAQIMA